MAQKSSKAAKTKPKKEKPKKEPIEDHSNYKVEVWTSPTQKRVFTFDWEGHMVDKDNPES